MGIYHIVKKKSMENSELALNQTYEKLGLIYDSLYKYFFVNPKITVSFCPHHSYPNLDHFK